MSSKEVLFIALGEALLCWLFVYLHGKFPSPPTFIMLMGLPWAMSVWFGEYL